MKMRLDEAWPSDLLKSMVRVMAERMEDCSWHLSIQKMKFVSAKGPGSRQECVSFFRIRQEMVKLQEVDAMWKYSGCKSSDSFSSEERARETDGQTAVENKLREIEGRCLEEVRSDQVLHTLIQELRVCSCA